MRLIAFGLGLLLAGWAVIFAMTLRLLEPGFALSFLAYGASLAGLVAGLIGVVQSRRGGD